MAMEITRTTTPPSGTTETAGRNPASNLTQEDRIRGGRRSAQLQRRDASGQFAGRRADDGDGHQSLQPSPRDDGPSR